MLILLMAACETSAGDGTGRADDTLEFGDVVVAESSRLVLVLHNDGDGPLRVLDVALADGASFSAQATADEIDAGESGTIPVTFSPAARGELADTLTVTTDDPANPALTVALTGRGIAPDFEADPLDHDLGPVPIGCSASAEFWVSNIGELPLTLFRSELGSEPSIPGEFSFLTLTEFSSSVEPGATQGLRMTYAPADLGPDLWKTSFETNDPVIPNHAGTWTMEGVEAADCP